MQKILILGGGFAGYHVAKGLEKQLKDGEAEVTIVDIRTHMCYQPFLAEVASGAIESRHIQVPLRSHLKKTNVVEAKAKVIDPVNKKVTVKKRDHVWDLEYDQLVITLGAVTKTFPTPGIADNAIGLKTTEEAVYIRNKVIENFSIADSLPVGDPRRKRLLTFIVVGGGFSGGEGFAEIVDLCHKLLKTHRNIKLEELELHLIEAADRILPELPPQHSQYAIDKMEARGAHVHLKTFVESAVDGVVKTSDGAEYPTDLIVWTAGTSACPVLRDSELPLDGRGRLRVRTDLRVEGDDGIVEGIWGCGDATVCQDLSGGGLPDGSCAPTAQHALRQANQLVKNLCATLRGGQLGDYFHNNAGCVAGLGAWIGIFASGKKKLIIKGPLAWCMHRGYHGFAMPTWERKLRIFGDWTAGLILGKDVTSTHELERPKAFFQKFAIRPKPKAETEETE